MDTCKNCIHFYQHFVLDEHRATAVPCGHCVRPRLKHRRPEDRACSHFEAGARPLPQRETVVNYLTTDFPEFITSLTLPPELGKQKCRPRIEAHDK